MYVHTFASCFAAGSNHMNTFIYINFKDQVESLRLCNYGITQHGNLKS